MHSHVNFDPRSTDPHRDDEVSSKRGPPHVQFEIGKRSRDRELVRTWLRPGLREFLQVMSEEFEPVLFTSAMAIYASPLLDRVEGRGASSAPQLSDADEPGAPIPSAFPNDPFPPELLPIFRHRLYRESTTSTYHLGLTKDISPHRIGKPLGRIVIIDDSWQACSHNPDSCIVVPHFRGKPDDTLFSPSASSSGGGGQLLALLRELKDMDGVRPRIMGHSPVREELARSKLNYARGPRYGTREDRELLHRTMRKFGPPPPPPHPALRPALRRGGPEAQATPRAGNGKVAAAQRT